MNILLIEDSKSWSALLTKGIEQASNGNIDIVLVSSVKKLANEISSILNGTFDIVLLDTNIDNGTTEEFIKKLLSNTDLMTPLMSISEDTDLAEKFGIPYLGKEGLMKELKNTKKLSKLISIYTNKRTNNKDKRTKALAKILSQEK